VTVAAGSDGGVAVAPRAISPAAPGSGANGGGGRNVPQEETFTVRPGGFLNPTAISSPPVTSIELRLVSHDGHRRHVLLLLTTTPHALTVPAHGRASVLLTGLTPGRYVLDVDGVARGALLIGG